MSRIWLDMGDLLAFATTFRRPSGIQRVLFELGRALREAESGDGRELGFVGRRGDDGFVALPWSGIAAVFEGLAAEEPTSSGNAAGLWRKAWRAQWQAVRALADVPRAMLPEPPVPKSGPAMAPGDVLLVAGSGWTEPWHLRRVQAACRAGVKVALLVYDLIPLRRPEWTPPAETARFRDWLDGMLDLASVTMAISQATARDLAAYLATRGVPQREIAVIRLGDGFASPSASGWDASLVPTEPFALFVSTIEIRKNHALLVEAWRVLLARFGADRVPLLVFAGREGALVGDLMRQLRASKFQDGRVRLLPQASDGTVAELYRRCDFTLFPSLYEGWGLPVTESLAAARPCLASSATSVPEAGGSLARYFDPLNLEDAVRVIGGTIADPAGLAAWAERVRAEFRPVPWSRTAAEVADAIRSAATAPRDGRDAAP